MAKWVLLAALAAWAPAGLMAQAAAPGVPASAAQPEMQAQRLAFIQRLIGAGVLDRIERPRDIPRVWVRPQFYAADFRDKQRAVGVVFAYYQQLHPGTDYVAVYDARSGKRVGQFAAAAGGLVMD
jgi:hypothetical protein